jgi:hypothetical protein
MSRIVRSRGNSSSGSPWSIKAWRTSAADRFVSRRRRLEFRIGVRLGFDDRGDVRRQWRVLRFAALAAARGEVPQAADRVTKRVPSRRDGVASPAEASFGVAGAAVAQFGGHLGQEQSTLNPVSRLAPDRIRASKRSTASCLRVALPDGETVIDPPKVSHHLGGQDSSAPGRFPPAGRLNPDTQLDRVCSKDLSRRCLTSRFITRSRLRCSAG